MKHTTDEAFYFRFTKNIQWSQERKWKRKSSDCLRQQQQEQQWRQQKQQNQ